MAELSSELVREAREGEETTFWTEFCDFRKKAYGTCEAKEDPSLYGSGLYRPLPKIGGYYLRDWVEGWAARPGQMMGGGGQNWGFMKDSGRPKVD